MGRPFVEYLSDDRCKRLTCGACSVDVASTSSVVWEGVMGTQSMPAVLCDHTLNCEAYTLQRQERLSTGMYTLQDVRCRACQCWLGWLYLAASSPDQKFKEGRMLLQVSTLARTPPRDSLTAMSAAHKASGAAPAANSLMQGHWV